MAINVDIHKKLGDFSLDINFNSSARRIGILGASGCGKSMTLRCLAGIEKPDRGNIILDGKTIFDSAKRINEKAQKRNIGYLFQNYALFPTMTVKDNIGVGIKGKKQEKENKIKYYIDKFKLQGLEKHLPGELSGGQQQRVALARIMAYEPAMILLDEPFSALDMYLKDQLQHELLKMLEDYRGIVIMVSHSRDEIYRFSQELLIIDQGQTICQGECKKIFQSPGKKEAARLTGCKNIVKANRIDAHVIEIPEWELLVNCEREIPEDTEWVGYRAHDFIPVWEKKEKNSLKINSYHADILPFETKYYVKCKKEMTDICWFVQREHYSQLTKKGFPDYLQLSEDKILFLN